MKWLLYTLVASLIIWILLTIWANYWGEQKISRIIAPNPEKRALIIYNPDPIYNLDEQICQSFANGLATSNYSSTIATIDFAKQETEDYDLYVFCANTYNWAPDWLIKSYINNSDLVNKPVIAITIGSGATSRAKRILEKTIINRGANLIASKTFWLMRPNDETRMNESNVKVANEIAFNLGKELK